ncbi:hypothetical protein EPUS_00246 [Endocarpon pusillum Z07020]|uniref:Uncharacterized protein n=1 Tax=Endocarpon pusillum (strain Z07020 / HMAS-L-300199) TaxID=1263415 RepID=U1HM33_ENDPU|nr:uncharacterized protein EPUS_00246 [Endocarpon pusillum Z07020]ERF70059.1 hypothetical protein EPUS_00246 [Endocarpon pusillum Z07020]
MVSLERFLNAGREIAWALKDHDHHTFGHASSYGGVDTTTTPKPQPRCDGRNGMFHDPSTTARPATVPGSDVSVPDSTLNLFQSMALADVFRDPPTTARPAIIPGSDVSVPDSTLNLFQARALASLSAIPPPR